MKIAIINPNNILDRILGSGKIFTKPDIPIGLNYIVSYLRQHGYNAVLRDSYFLNDKYEDVLNFLTEYQPDIIGISCLTANGKYVYELGKLIKKKYPDILIVLGNLHASVFSEFYLKHQAADVIVHGEGEITILELCKSVEKKNTFDSIKGISWKDGDTIVHNPKREFIENLDDLPIPYLEDLNYEEYPLLKSHKKPYMKIVTSRGCINKCTFCAVHNGRKYRKRSVESVIKEIEFYMKRFKVKRFSFEDPLFIADSGRVFEFCEQLKIRQIDIAWACEGHINCLSERLLKKMAEAGCISMAIGIESGNQTILNNIKKKIKLKDIEEKITLATRYIKETIGMFIIGLPGETVQTINETINFALKLPISYAQFSMFTPYPGTESYYTLLNEKKIEVNENNPDELVDSWERYSSYAIFADNAPQPIYIPDDLTLKDIKRLQKLAIRKFFFRFKYLLPVMLKRPSHLSYLGFKDILPFFNSVIKLFRS